MRWCEVGVAAGHGDRLVAQLCPPLTLGLWAALHFINADDYTSEELARVTWQKAVEWQVWPAFLSHEPSKRA
jgi:hypothetical protein